MFITIVLESVPVQRLSDLTSLIIHGFTLCTHFSVAFCITFTMEDLDFRLFIAGVEVSCWQGQLRQAVSIYIFFLIFISDN